MKFSMQRILGLQRILEEHSINVHVAAKSLEQDLDNFLVSIMRDIEDLQKVVPNIKE